MYTDDDNYTNFQLIKHNRPLKTRKLVVYKDIRLAYTQPS